MSEQPDSTRRAFLKGGALAAAPLAAAGAAAVAAKSGHAAEIERLQAEAAIRDLHQAWLRKVNIGADTSALFVDRKRARLRRRSPGSRPIMPAPPTRSACTPTGFAPRPATPAWWRPPWTSSGL